MPFELRPSRSSDSNRLPTSITSDQALENFNRVLSQAIASHFRNSLPSPLRDGEMDNTANHNLGSTIETDNPSDLASTMDLTEFLGIESDEESSETRSSLQHNHSSNDSEVREAPRAWQNFVDITLDEEVASLASDELLPFPPPPTNFDPTDNFMPDRQSHADVSYQPLTNHENGELINTDSHEVSLMSEDEEGSLLRRPDIHTNAENDINSISRSIPQQNTTVVTLPLQSFPSLGRRRVGRDPYFYTHLLTRPYTPPPIPNRSSTTTNGRSYGLPSRISLSTLSSPLPPLHRGLSNYQPRSISPSASSSETSAISASSSPSLLPRRPLSPSPSPPPRRRKVSYDDSDIDDELPIQPSFPLQSLYEISRHPTKPCSFLQPGRVFLGEQCLKQRERAANHNRGRTISASSSLSPASDQEHSTERVIRRFYEGVDSSELNSYDTRSNSFASPTSNAFGRHRPFFQSLLQRQPRDRDRSPVRSTTEQEKDDRWEVKVTLHTVDLDAGVLTGLMEALNVPAMGATTVVTSWEGEIVDGCTNSLWTGKWNAKKETDLKHWRRMLEEIEDLPQGPEDERIERGRALTHALKAGEIPCYVSERYILMRWKERSFVNITPQEAGLTIAGFYYVLLRRSDGVVRGFYHDPHSAPFQRLELSVVPEGRGFGFGRFAFA